MTRYPKWQVQETVILVCKVFLALLYQLFNSLEQQQKIFHFFILFFLFYFIFYFFYAACTWPQLPCFSLRSLWVRGQECTEHTFPYGVPSHAIPGVNTQHSQFVHCGQTLLYTSKQHWVLPKPGLLLNLLPDIQQTTQTTFFFFFPLAITPSASWKNINQTTSMMIQTV